METQKKDAFALFDKSSKSEPALIWSKRPMVIGGHNAALYMVDGFVKDEIMEKDHGISLFRRSRQVDACPDMPEFRQPLFELCGGCRRGRSRQDHHQVLSGTIAAVMEQYPQVLMIDARTYPSRSVSEPETTRCFAALTTGFVEALVFNTALIRRRIGM